MNSSVDIFPTFVSTKKKVLIIGNGFDLALHLPTLYSEFINFLNKLINHDRSKNSFDDLFQDVISEKKFNNLKLYYKLDEINFDICKITGYESNIWYKHFSNILDLETWIDFENEIENVLNNIAIFFKQYEKKIVNGENWKLYSTLNKENLTEKSDLKNLYHLLFDFDILNGWVEDKSKRSKNDNNGLKNPYKKNSKNTLEFVINEKYISKNDSLDKGKIINNLLMHLNEFIPIFYNYFNFIVSPICKRIKNPHKFDNFDYLFSFNYTKSFENFKIFKEQYHLHGFTAENMVLGVNFVDHEILTKDAIGFTKLHQNILKNTHALFFINNEFSKNDPCSFYIFGHSLGLSDKKYIDIIIKMLENEKKEHSITIFYHNSDSKDTLLKNLLSMYDQKLIENYFSKSKIKLSPAPNLLSIDESTKQ